MGNWVGFYRSVDGFWTLGFMYIVPGNDLACEYWMARVMADTGSSSVLFWFDGIEMQACTYLW